MNTVKQLLALLFLITFTFACGDDDDSSSPQLNTNEAIIDGTTYQIKSASLGLDAGPSFNNQFSLVFTNGLINVTSTNVPTVDTNSTTMGIMISITLGNTPLSTEQAVVNNITTTTYNLDDDTSAFSNIINFTDTYFKSGVEYGEIDESGATTFEVTNVGGGTVTINSFSVDLSARTGMVDCNFSFSDANGKTISGNYNGALTIHDDR